jgi:putative endopeptidase
MKNLWLGAAAAALLCAAWPAGAQTSGAQAAPATSDLSKAPRMGTWGYDLAGRNLATPPGQDFFEYANGTYLKALEIPADRTNWGAFAILNELSQNRMHAVVEKAAADRASAGDVAKVGALYGSFMDEKTVESLGARPLAPDLARIRAEKTRADIARTMGRSMMGFGGSVFSASVSDDAKDPEHYAVYLGQAGLGLPDRDYYLQPQFAAQKAKFETYVAQMLTLAGWPEPAANAKAIVALETEIAKVSWTRAERRDDEKMYNTYPTDKVGGLAPGFDAAQKQAHADALAKLSAAGAILQSSAQVHAQFLIIDAGEPGAQALLCPAGLPSPGASAPAYALPGHARALQEAFALAWWRLSVERLTKQGPAKAEGE